MWSEELGTIKRTEKKIELTQRTRPMCQKPHKADMRSRDFEHEEVWRMLKEAIIEPSHAECARPVVLIRKSDASIRFCVDYWRLNSLTVRDSYLIPRMDKLITIRIRRLSPTIRGCTVICACLLVYATHRLPSIGLLI